MTALLNSLQAYLTLHYTRQVYASSSLPKTSTTTTSQQQLQVNPLQSRTFGTWTSLSSIIRLYAAYHITDPLIYQLALWSYVIAWGHFMSEWLVFGTAKWGRGLAGPVVVSTGSLVWMGWCWGEYVE